MNPIYPINVKQCRPHYGKPVVLMLHDGTQLTGIMSRIENGKLHLNAEEAVKTKARKKAAKPAKKLAKTAAFPDPDNAYPPNATGPALAVDLPQIALLFTII